MMWALAKFHTYFGSRRVTSGGPLTGVQTYFFIAGQY